MQLRRPNHALASCLTVLCTTLLACSNDSGGSDPPPEQSNLPGRSGTNGEQGEQGAAGPTGPRGERGESGVVAATEIFGNKGSALPVSGTFTTSGGRLLVTISGTGYRAGTAGLIGVNVSIDGTVIGALNTYANEITSHKTLPSRTFVVTGIPAGDHTLTISAQAGTLTDAFDFFNANALELR